MMIISLRLVCGGYIVSILLIAPGLAAHNHVTVKTPSGEVNQQISIDAGYYPSERFVGGANSFQPFYSPQGGETPAEFGGVLPRSEYPADYSGVWTPGDYYQLGDYKYVFNTRWEPNVFSVRRSEIQQNGTIVTYRGDTVVPAGKYANTDKLDGFIQGSGLTLTSDFYFNDGVLGTGWDGLSYVQAADFYYEIMGVRALTGASGPIVFGLAVEANDELENVAMSTGTDRLARSFHVGAGEHPHGQAMFASDAGLYAIELTAWDASGQFLDSAPLSFQFLAVPEPGSASMIVSAIIGLVLLKVRIRKYR